MLAAHLLLSMRATSIPGTMRNNSRIVVAQERRIISWGMTKMAAGDCPTVLSLRETLVTSTSMSCSRLNLFNVLRESETVSVWAEHGPAPIASTKDVRRTTMTPFPTEATVYLSDDRDGALATSLPRFAKAFDRRVHAAHDPRRADGQNDDAPGAGLRGRPGALDRSAAATRGRASGSQVLDRQWKLRGRTRRAIVSQSASGRHVDTRMAGDDRGCRLRLDGLLDFLRWHARHRPGRQREKHNHPALRAWGHRPDDPDHARHALRCHVRPGRQSQSVAAGETPAPVGSGPERGVYIRCPGQKRAKHGLATSALDVRRPRHHHDPGIPQSHGLPADGIRRRHRQCGGHR